MKFRLVKAPHAGPVFGLVIEWNWIAGSAIAYCWRWAIVFTVWWRTRSEAEGTE